MNSLIILALASCLVLAQGAAGPNLKEKLVELSKKCAEETKASPDDMKILRSRTLPSNEKERCFLECLYKGAGIVKDDAFSAEGAKKLAAIRYNKREDVVKVNALIDTCSKEVSKKEGETCSLSYSVRDCILKNGKEINFFGN